MAMNVLKCHLYYCSNAYKGLAVLWNSKISVTIECPNHMSCQQHSKDKLIELDNISCGFSRFPISILIY